MYIEFLYTLLYSKSYITIFEVVTMIMFEPFCAHNLPGGDIVIKLAKSEYFDADTAAGEDPSLEKIEANYRGGEFDVQFACKFKDRQPTNRDIFGKVFVKRRIDGREEKLFEFNLIQVS